MIRDKVKVDLEILEWKEFYVVYWTWTKWLSKNQIINESTGILEPLDSLLAMSSTVFIRYVIWKNIISKKKKYFVSNCANAVRVKSNLEDFRNAQKYRSNN